MLLSDNAWVGWDKQTCWKQQVVHSSCLASKQQLRQHACHPLKAHAVQAHTAGAAPPVGLDLSRLGALRPRAVALRRQQLNRGEGCRRKGAAQGEQLRRQQKVDCN